MFIAFAWLLAAAIPPVSREPNRQPQLAASQRMVALVFGNGHSVMFAKSADGESFSRPVSVAEYPALALGRHRGPRVALSGSAVLVSAIGGAATAGGEHAHGLPADGNLLVWRSADEGKNWSKAAVINDLPGSAREGLHAMAADGEGHAAAVWLDLRHKGTRLYGAASKDAGITWSPNFLVYQSPGGTICQCCHPSLLPLGGGEFAVMFRNVLDGGRDMYVLRFRGSERLSPAEKAGKGSWEINACPMDGGGLASSGRRALTAWRRGEQIFLASPGTEETRIGEGKDVALAARDARIFAVWTSREGIQSWVSGKAELLSRSGAFPAIAALPRGGALAAWEENGAIAFSRLK